ncbi:unnamed protein product [Clonostachys solani]|uniref:Tubulin-specific chaperone A n=1 Tax=Clonostachys solani TaxID=160281 RepID=A0A9N9W671_9HYPO|nr:unnamed protein product [Clonostachys solani]
MATKEAKKELVQKFVHENAVSVAVTRGRIGQTKEDIGKAEQDLGKPKGKDSPKEASPKAEASLTTKQRLEGDLAVFESELKVHKAVEEELDKMLPPMEER